MKQTLLSIFFLSTWLFTNPESNPGAITGTWLVEKKNGKVLIYKQGNSYFGKIIWIKHPYLEDGTPRKDVNNPDPEKRNEPIVGLIILKNFLFKGGHEWSEGTIYDPQNGKEYDCILSLTNPNKLDVRGYIGFSWIGRTETWTRIE